MLEIATLEANSLAQLFGDNGANQRYSLHLLASSKRFETNDKKSVWVEHPVNRGKTILCSFGETPCIAMEDEQFFNPHQFYRVENCLIRFNTDEPTYAPWQLRVDGLSTIVRIPQSNGWPRFNLGRLADAQEEPAYMDLALVPILDKRDARDPRRLILADENGQTISWTLWEEDAQNEQEIANIMNQPIVIRNGLVKFYINENKPEFREAQVNAELCSIWKNVNLPIMADLARFAREEARHLDLSTYITR